VEILVTR